MPDPAELSVQLYTVRVSSRRTSTPRSVGSPGSASGGSRPFELLAYHERLAGTVRQHGRPPRPPTLTSWRPISRAVSGPPGSRHWDGHPALDRIRSGGRSAAEIRADGRRAERRRDRAAPNGLRVGYHNHHFELESRDRRPPCASRSSPTTRPGRRPRGRHLLGVRRRRRRAGAARTARRPGRGAPRQGRRRDRSTRAARSRPARASLPIPAILAAAPEALRVVELDDTDGRPARRARATAARFLLGARRWPEDRTRARRRRHHRRGHHQHARTCANLTRFPDTTVLAIGDVLAGCRAQAKAAEHGVATAGDVDDGAGPSRRRDRRQPDDPGRPRRGRRRRRSPPASTSGTRSRSPLDRAGGAGVLDAAAARRACGSAARRTRSSAPGSRPPAG